MVGDVDLLELLAGSGDRPPVVAGSPSHAPRPGGA
jgi:hypothetical protein